MELLRVTRNAWGQETLQGVSWNLLWVFVGAAVVFIVAHLLYKRFAASPSQPGNGDATETNVLTAKERLLRHRLVDRLYHWTMAASVLVLLGTSFLPIVGLKFPWIDAHWIAGLVLTVVVCCHMVRALFWQDRRSMAVGLAELRAGLGRLRSRAAAPERPGRYPLLQKLYHHGIAATVLLAVATGLVMMAKIDGPFWTRDPYLLGSGTWAVLYIVHDLAALIVLAALLVHVYFALRPEKLWNTRSMILGWITRSEYLANYDPALWRAEPVARTGPPARVTDPVANQR